MNKRKCAPVPDTHKQQRLPHTPLLQSLGRVYKMFGFMHFGARHAHQRSRRTRHIRRDPVQASVGFNDIGPLGRLPPCTHLLP